MTKKLKEVEAEERKREAELVDKVLTLKLTIAELNEELDNKYRELAERDNQTLILKNLFAQGIINADGKPVKM